MCSSLLRSHTIYNTYLIRIKDSKTRAERKIYISNSKIELKLFVDSAMIESDSPETFENDRRCTEAQFDNRWALLFR